MPYSCTTSGFFHELLEIGKDFETSFLVFPLQYPVHVKFQEVYLKKLMKSQNMLYFLNLWYKNTWSQPKRRISPYIIMFGAFVRNMPVFEKWEYFEPLVDLFYKLINSSHVRAIRKFLKCNKPVPRHLNVMPCFLYLFRTLRRQHPQAFKLCDFAICECSSALQIEEYDFLTLLPAIDLDFVLHSYALRKKGSFHLEAKDLLMKSMEMDRKDVVKTLSRHGFKYYFHKNYYQKCILKLLRNDVKVDGKRLGKEINIKIAYRLRLRFQMAVELLHAIFSPKMLKEDKKIISRIWKVVPYPFITEKEMFQILKPFFYGDYIQLKDLCAIYARKNDIFPVPSVKTPRSLKHLSKVQVRQNLLNVRGLCNKAVNALKLSDELKKYVWKLDAF